MKEVNIQNIWTFELGTQEELNVLIWTIIGFQQRERQASQNLNNDNFCRPPGTNAQCPMGTEKHTDSAILFISDVDDFSQRHGQIKEDFTALPKDDILQPSIIDHDFRSSNEGNDFGYILYIFNNGYEKNLESAQPIKLECKFPENIPAGVYGYAFVLTNTLFSIGSDKQ